MVDTSSLRPAGFNVTLGAPGAAREGAMWTRRGLFVDATGSIWTATVDYGDGAGPQVLALAADNSFSLAHTWADDGRRDVRVVVANEQGKSAEATVHVDVTNVAPRVAAGGAARVAGRAVFTRRGSFTDPGADTWRGTVAWGDGSASRPLALAADKTFALAHRFPARRGRSYTVVVTVRDDDGGRGTARFTVTVR